MTPIDRIAHTNRWRTRALIEKLVLALGLMTLALALPPGLASLAVIVAAGLACVRGAGVPLHTWGLLLAAPLGFVLTGAVTLLFAVGPDGIGLAPGGLAAACALTLRATAAIAALSVLTLTTPATDLVAGARRIGVPADIVEIALLTYRFLLLLGDTALAMHSAQAARLGHVGFARRIRSAGLIAANLLPRALDRAHRLEIALAARGWTGGDIAVLSPSRAPTLPGLVRVAATLVTVALIGLAPLLLGTNVS